MPGANELIGDAAPAPTDEYRGSPLCRITPDRCDPNDDGSKKVEPPCAKPPPADGGITSDPKGCRLTGPLGKPECLEANPENTDGAKCATGADCAPGFDCVASDGQGYCRRYCCTGSCGTHRSQNGAETFCDVQKLHGGTTKAPVCMPIKTCKLFLAGECADNETCGVVTDDGTTGCVANGLALEGDKCDVDHCNVGLTCLGQTGSRKCFRLCRTTKAGPACGQTQICKTSTIFDDPAIGVCVPDQ